MKHWRAKLDVRKVRKIRRLWNNGATQGELARQFGVAQATIYQIVHRGTWRHIKA